MNKDKHALWYEKYRPRTLEEYVFHDESHRVAFQEMVDNKTIPHMLLSGVQGTGKTTIALILIDALELDDTDILTLNASDENNVEVIREKIKSFVTTYAMGDFKVVHLQEADYISAAGQGILRGLTEDYADNARFVLTCNYEHKIIPALRSRFSTGHFRFKKHDINQITEFAAQILINEKIHFDLDTLDRFVRVGYPDIRAIVGSLQLNSMSGSLVLNTDTGGGNDYKFALLDYIEQDDWFAARKLACEEVTAEEWEDVYRFLYENLREAPKFRGQDKWEAGIVIIADHLYKHSLVADPEINAAAMFIRLAQV